MKTISSADDILDKYSCWVSQISDNSAELVMSIEDCKDAMIAFAKLHVQAAVKNINAVKYDRISDDVIDELTEETLKNFYPLNNII